jgi:hypothetical protein
MYVKNKMAWEHNNDLLTTLCHECHERITFCKFMIDSVFSNLSPSEFAEFAESLNRAATINDASYLFTSIRCTLDSLEPPVDDATSEEILDSNGINRPF